MSPEGMNVSSGADLMSSVPSDLFESATAEDFGGDETTADVEASPEVEAPDIEEPVVDETPAEEEVAEDEAAEPADEAAEEAKPEEPAEELPEGVKRGKDRNGKEGLWLTPQRYETFHGAHKLLQQTADQWGEPITPEGLDVRNRAFVAQERLFGDLLSGDPTAQASVLNHFLSEGARALQEGEVGTDPIVPLAQTFYSTLRESHPDAYANLRLQAAKDLVSELYEEAGGTGNKNLWLSLAHVADALKLPWRKTDEFATFSQRATDPLVAAQKRIQDLESQINGRQVNSQAAQYDSWRQATGQSVKSAVLDGAVKPALTDTQAAWEKFPDAYNDLVVDRLHSAVKDTIEKDQRFSERINMLNQQARRATSAQKRSEIGEQIKQAYINRAKLAVEAHKPKILADAARILKERSDANHERRKAAPTRGPKGPSSPVTNTKLPDNVGQIGGQFSMDQAMKDMARLFG